MSIVTQLPNVSAQTRVFISGRSIGTWHGDLRIYTNRGEGDGRNGEVGGNTGACVGMCLQTNAEFKSPLLKYPRKPHTPD